MKTIQEYIEELKAFKERSLEKNYVPAVSANVTNETNELPEDVNKGTGNLVVIVTHSRGTFPVVNAQVTVYDTDENVITTAKTDLSGRTPEIVLDTYSKDLSERPEGSNTPINRFYNIFIEADRYVSALIKNVPIFEGVTTLQRYDMTFASSVTDQSTQVVELTPNENL